VAESKRRWRRVAKWLGAVLAVLVLVAGGVAWWALDRYIFEHVEVGDAKAYEASVLGTTTTLPPLEIVVTDDYYSDGTTTISIDKVVEGTGDETLTYYVADVRVPDATYFKSAFAKNKFGSNVVEDTSRIARANNAILAINGDYYGFRRTGLMIRNGVSYMNQPRRTALALYRDGTMRVVKEKSTSTKELLAAGVWNMASFGPALVDGGRVLSGIDEVEIDTNQVENAIRPTAVGKKNWLFIGHPKAGQMSAVIYTIVENCRMHSIDPMEYLLDVLPRIEDHPMSRVAELLPPAWKERQDAA
jgi:hypothetical protein